MRNSNFLWKWHWIVILIIVILMGSRLYDSLQWNVRALTFLKGGGESISSEIPNCKHFALLWAEASKRGSLLDQHNILEYALACSRINLSLVSVIFPYDPDLAILATQLYPNSSEAWFWLGKTLALTDHFQARQAFSRSLVLSPNKGEVWCHLALIYEIDSQYENALNTYLNCCHFDDPGFGGCSGAGRMMELLDDPQQAIKFYRLSKWDVALERANELEYQFGP